MHNSPDLDIMFIVKRRNVSYSYKAPFGLLYSARFVAAMLRANGVKAEAVQVDDGNCIDKVVTNMNPKVVVLEALWATPAKLKELMSLKRHCHRKWVVRVHSKTSFLSMEGIAMKWLAEFVELSYEFPGKLILASNNCTANREFSNVFRYPFMYLPNYYIPSGVEQQGGRKFNRKHVKIGCFGAVRPLKNTLEQAFAAIIYANSIKKKLKFYVNGNRIEQSGDNVLRNVRALFDAQPEHELIEVDWQTHSDFVDLISTMDLGMQVSFSESFNIVTADFASVGVPIVVSEEIEWMPDGFKVTPTNAIKMAIKLGDLDALPRLYTRFRMRNALKHHNRTSAKIWLSYIKGEKKRWGTSKK